jgi:hypothetical protein
MIILDAAYADPNDPTAYYPDFWNYASLYGEEAARAYYTTWSPPVGTPPPPGIVLPAAAGPVQTGGELSSGAAVAATGGEVAAPQSDMSPEVSIFSYYFCRELICALFRAGHCSGMGRVQPPSC